MVASDGHFKNNKVSASVNGGCFYYLKVYHHFKKGGYVYCAVHCDTVI